MNETLGSSPISTRLQKIAQLASQAPTMVLTTLAHHLDLPFLREAYRRTRKDGAVGVDGVTMDTYAADLEANLQTLLERAKSGSYRAPPVRRHWIPKGDGTSQRPIGIPTVEDKILQRAVAMLLEAVYEQDFLDSSYGFRPGRSAHQALRNVREHLMSRAGSWVIEVDIQGFFDAMNHQILRDLISRRVRDGVILRLLGKWLNAGVLEAGKVSASSVGSPQGGVISPLLANVYLHEAFDLWFDHEIKPTLGGSVDVVRYADDIVIMLSSKEEADAVMALLPKRFALFGLRLHPDKTRLIDFRHPQRNGGGGEVARRDSFDLLGFTHFWAKSHRGSWVIKRATAKSRMRRALRNLWEWCRSNRHYPLQWQATRIGRKLLGHAAYFGISGNSRRIAQLWHEAKRIWLYWLCQRSQRSTMTWKRFHAFLRRTPLPAPRLVHSL